ncbi:DinB family protein [Vreelandella gomseomensis]|uniref:DinB family protein n=1 Tax=Vreelandella gomseomensis TaxID=370766 RepID=A0ABU1G7R4_9GAMM|nr:DinB family protein [Halomonas gomseomensis]MDR5873527.1 DinB family protein [Halomonas gomseomensis]
MSTSSLSPLIDENVQTLAQLAQLLGRVSAHDYQRPLGAKGTQSLGKHVRHILEHYQTLLDACATSSPQTIFDYENRLREAALETQPGYAGDRTEALQAGLTALATMPHDAALTLNYPVKGDADDSVALPTSLGRELAFLTSHSIHHMALLGLLCEQLGIALPEHFGVHPSTLRYWARSSSQKELSA